MPENIHTKIKVININPDLNLHKIMLGIIAYDYEEISVNERDCAL
jgi:hypothetical protein